MELEQNSHKWPKKPPQLSPEQEVAREKWMHLWHQVLPNKYRSIERFNHGWPASLVKETNKIRTLEVGAGLGEHVQWENLSCQDYSMLEYRPEWVEKLKSRHPGLQSVCGDIQLRLDFADESFDRVIAIHVLEHLLDLPNALKEIYRLLKRGGCFDIVIPCEGGPAYEFARQISSERLFRKHFGMPYGPINRAEHVNSYPEVVEEVAKLPWKKETDAFFPLKIPVWQINLCVGMRLIKT